MPPDQRDLHEIHRTLASLGPYEHLLRIFRLCVIHVGRNINSAAVTDVVKEKMRSLICMTHPDMDRCLHEISTEGGKAGAGMSSRSTDASDTNRL